MWGMVTAFRTVVLLLLCFAFEAAFARRHMRVIRRLHAKNATVAATPVELELNPEGRKALRALLLDLISIGPDTSFGVKKLSETESLDEFLPKCKAHVQELVKTVDAHYTDVQLETVLTHECQLSQEFPHTHPSNFESHEACLKFAKKLTAARMQELETGETKQYQQFCAEYYDEAIVGGNAPQAPARKTKAAPPQEKPAKKSSAEALRQPVGWALVVLGFFGSFAF